MAKKLINRLTRTENQQNSNVEADVLRDYSVGAFLTDEENRTLWVNGMPYGNAYISFNASGIVNARQPKHAEVFNNFDRNKAEGHYSHVEGGAYVNTVYNNAKITRLETPKTIGQKSYRYSVPYTNVLYKMVEVMARKDMNIPLYVVVNNEGRLDPDPDSDSQEVTETSNDIITNYDAENTLLAINKYGNPETDDYEGSDAQLENKVTSDEPTKYYINGYNYVKSDKLIYFNVATSLDTDSEIKELPTYCDGKTMYFHYYYAYDGKDGWSEATRDGAHAEGVSQAHGVMSHTEGFANRSYEDYSHTEGVGNEVYGLGAHAEGDRNIVTNSAPYSHAEGHMNIAKADSVHVEGRNNLGNNTGAHVEGGRNIVNGIYGHAEGYGNTVNNDYGHAEGIGTITTNDAEHAEGRYNVSEDRYISSIGIGTEETPKNAVTILDDGRIYVAETSEIVNKLNKKFNPCAYNGLTIDNNAKSLQQLLSNIGSNIEYIKYSQLKQYIETNNLTPGKFYEIIDYNVTYNTDNLIYSGHKFNIIVFAIDTNLLSESAYVVKYKIDKNLFDFVAIYDSTKTLEIGDNISNISIDNCMYYNINNVKNKIIYKYAYNTSTETNITYENGNSIDVNKLQIIEIPNTNTTDFNIQYIVNDTEKIEYVTKTPIFIYNESSNEYYIYNYFSYLYYFDNEKFIKNESVENQNKILINKLNINNFVKCTPSVPINNNPQTIKIEIAGLEDILFLDCIELNGSLPKIISDTYITNNNTYYNYRKLHAWNIKYDINNCLLQNNNFINDYITYFCDSNIQSDLLDLRGTLSYYLPTSILLNYDKYIPAYNFGDDSILNYTNMFKQTNPFVQLGINNNEKNPEEKYCILSNKLYPYTQIDSEYNAILCESDNIEQLENTVITDLYRYNNVYVTYKTKSSDETERRQYNYIFNCISPDIENNNIFPIYSCDKTIDTLPIPDNSPSLFIVNGEDNRPGQTQPDGDSDVVITVIPSVLPTPSDGGWGRTHTGTDTTNTVVNMYETQKQNFIIENAGINKTNFYIKIDNVTAEDNKKINSDFCIFYSTDKECEQLIRGEDISSKYVVNDYVVNMQLNSITTIMCNIPFEENGEEKIEKIYFTSVDNNEFTIETLPKGIRESINNTFVENTQTKYKIFKYLYKTTSEITEYTDDLIDVAWEILDGSNFNTLSDLIHSLDTENGDTGDINNNYAFTYGTTYIVAGIINGKLESITDDNGNEILNAYLFYDDIPCEYTDAFNKTELDNIYSSYLTTTNIVYANSPIKTDGTVLFNETKFIDKNVDILAFAYNLKNINYNSIEFSLKHENVVSSQVICSKNLYEYQTFNNIVVEYNGDNYAIYENDNTPSYGILFNFINNVNNIYYDNIYNQIETPGATLLFGNSLNAEFYAKYYENDVETIENNEESNANGEENSIIDNKFYQIPCYEYTYIKKIANIGNLTDPNNLPSKYITYYYETYFSKGNIYYMLDEFNNEANYDISNVAFKRQYNDKVKYFYTFSSLKQESDENIISDALNNIGNNITNNTFLTNNVYNIETINNVILNSYSDTLNIHNNYFYNTDSIFNNTYTAANNVAKNVYIVNNNIRNSENINFNNYTTINSNTLNNCINITASGAIFNNSLIIDCVNKQFNGDINNISLFKNDDEYTTVTDSPTPLFSFENFKILSNNAASNIVSGYNNINRSIDTKKITNNFTISGATGTNIYNYNTYKYKDSGPTGIKNNWTELPNSVDILKFEYKDTSKVSGIYGTNKTIPFGNIHTFAGSQIYCYAGQSKPYIGYNIKLIATLSYIESNGTTRVLDEKEYTCSNGFECWSKNKWTTYYGQIIFNCGIDLTANKFIFEEVKNGEITKGYCKICCNDKDGIKREIGETLNLNESGQFILTNIQYKLTVKSFKVSATSNSLNGSIGDVMLGYIYHNNNFAGNKKLNAFTVYNYTTQQTDDYSGETITYTPGIIKDAVTKPVILICNDGILCKIDNDNYTKIIPGENIIPVKNQQ